MRVPIFPRWANKTRAIGGVLLGIAPIYLVCLVWYTFSPNTTNVGYAPEQPIPYSHALHAGELGIDCRYCHTTVEDSSFAAIPTTDTCLNCHQRVRKDSPKLAPLFRSAETGGPVRWKKVHDLPDYAFFNHSAHVTKGVGCATCHGRVDTMETVYQAEPLSMGWCLDCHRNPDPNLRPLDQITNMGWQPPEEENAVAYGAKLRAAHGVNPRTDCSTCHR